MSTHSPAVNTSDPTQAARSLLAAIDTDAADTLDPELVRAVVQAFLSVPAPQRVYGVEYMAADWASWVDEKVQPSVSEAAARETVRSDGALCRVVSRVEYENAWLPTGYAPKLPANPENAVLGSR